MKEYMKIDCSETIFFKLRPEQVARLGDMYENGEGVARDEERAANCYWWSAMLGDPYAQTVLANHYLMGKHIQRDEKQALIWFEKSAEQGNPYAQYELGMHLPDEQGALLWLHASAKQGFPSAMKALSDRLRETDPKRAQRWLRRYYRKKNKCGMEHLNGRKYVRRLRSIPMPRVIDGEVVIQV